MIKAAATKIDITPPIGIDLQGYAGRYKGADGILDPLYARCAVVESVDGTRWALISADVISFENDESCRIRETAKAALGAPHAAVSLAATHTHSGPALLRLRNFGERNRAYVAYLVESIGRSVQDAVRRLQPAVAVTRTGRTGFAVNRRKPEDNGRIALAPYPEGPVDHIVTVTSLFPYVEDRDHQSVLCAPIAVFTNYACHPVTLGANYLISADFPGVYARAVETVFPGSVALYLNGASGDINPPAMDGRLTTEQCGFELAGEVLKLIAQGGRAARTAGGAAKNAVLTFGQRCVKIPLGTLPSREVLLANLAEYQAKVEDLGSRNDGSVNSWRALKSWAEGCLAEIDGETTVSHRTEAHIQVVGLGDTAMVFVPGELFVELGLAIRSKSPYPYTHVIGYANGWVGYLPTQDAVAKGGYEPTAYRYWQSRPPALEAGEVIVNEAVDLLFSCHRRISV